MKDKINLVLRVLLGLILLTFGLNKFFQFMPMPDMPEPAGEPSPSIAIAKPSGIRARLKAATTMRRPTEPPAGRVETAVGCSPPCSSRY